MNNKIEVVHPDQVKQQPARGGFASRPLFESETDHIGEVRINGGTTGGWHSHGKRTMYGYVLSGKVNVEFGQGGRERVELSQGDLLVIHPDTVHRDVNPNREDVVLLIFNLGEGPASIEAAGPDL